MANKKSWNTTYRYWANSMHLSVYFLLLLIKKVCDVLSLSSAFHYMFDKNVADKIHSNKQGYIECSSELSYKKSRKASSLNFLNSIMMKKNQELLCSQKKGIDIFERYLSIKWLLWKYMSLYHQEQHVFLRPYHYNLWWFNFYGNLNYVFSLPEESLNWCTSRGREGIVFDIFLEQIQIGLKGKNFVNKNKKIFIIKF